MMPETIKIINIWGIYNKRVGLSEVAAMPIFKNDPLKSVRGCTFLWGTQQRIETILFIALLSRESKEVQILAESRFGCH